MNTDPAKQAWQASCEIGGPPPIEEVRKGADKFYRYVKWRNFVEYAACVVVVVVFTSYVFMLPHVLQKVGSALVVVAVFYAARQLHARASAVPPEKAGTMPLLQFAREQMVRQRDALQAILWWYLLPFVPGLVLIVAGTWIGERVSGPERFDAIGVAVMVVLFVGIWWLNQYAARKLQRHIDDIDTLIGEGQ